VPPPRSAKNAAANADYGPNSAASGGQQQRQQQQQQQQRQNREETKQRKVSSSSSPFDNLKDIFSNIANRE